MKTNKINEMMEESMMNGKQENSVIAGTMYESGDPDILTIFDINGGSGGK